LLGWQIESLFGEKLTSQCPLATTSQIAIQRDNVRANSSDFAGESFLFGFFNFKCRFFYEMQ